MEDKQRRRSRSLDDEQEALRKQAEDKLQSLNPNAPEMQSPEQVRQLLYELQIHQIEVEMQQEELRYTQQELEISETRYRHLYQYAPHGYFTLNAKGCITESNFAATMLVGIQRWVLEGWPLRIFIAKSHQQAFDQFFAEVCRTKVPQRCELQLQGLDEHRAGYLRTVLLEGISLTQASSEKSVYLLTAVDITDRKKAEQELQRVNLRLEEQVTRQTNELKASKTENEAQRMRLERYLIEAPTAICVLNGPDLLLDLINPAFQRLFPHRQLWGQPLVKALPEIASQRVWEMLQQVYRTGETVEGKEMCIFFARQPGGEPEERYFNFIYQACYEANEGVTGVLVVAYEVTELVMARKAVEESQQRFHTLLEASPQLIWTARPDGYLDYFNQRAERHVGRKSDQLRGQGWTSQIHPEDLPGLLKHWQRSIQTGEPYQHEARIRDKEGVYHWFLIRASARRDEQGSIAQWIGVAMDIDEKKILEERLRHLTQSLEENNQHLSAHNEEIQASNQRLHYINSDLDNFVYTASHDLRSPINSLNGLLQLLDESIQGKLQPEEQELVQHITTVLTKLNRTILDLTNISQEQQGGAQEAVDFQDIFQDVKVDLQPLIAQAQARIDAHFEVKSLLYPRKHLRSIVYNLLSNGIKYRASNRPCQVRINTFWQNDQVALSISDNGLGLDEQQQKKLFRAFRRLHYHVAGSGVGLYILKRIVDNNGGVIAVESKKEVGTTFTVLFSKADTPI